MMVSVAGVEQESGCWVDGHWGQYGASRVLRIADELLSLTLWDECRATMVENGEDVEGVATDELPGGSDESVWYSDNALELLNAATIGGYWEWVDGELFLTPIGECSACGSSCEWDGEEWSDEDDERECPAASGGPHIIVPIGTPAQCEACESAAVDGEACAVSPDGQHV